MFKSALFSLYVFFALLLITASSSSSSSSAFELHTMHDGKPTSFPELVGMSGEEAKKTLEAAHPDWTIQVMPQDAMMTMDYRTDRVRIMVDESGKVVKEPRVG